MTIDFSILDDHEAVLISISGHVTHAEVDMMRARTIALIEDKKFTNFVVDISAMLSIDDGSTFTAYKLGDNFRSTGFPLEAKTAVIMPSDPAAKEQAELLHTVQINRGRGAIRYVDSVDDGLYWFRSLRSQ